MIQCRHCSWAKTFYKENKWQKHKKLRSHYKVEDKKKFTSDIEALIKENGIYWYTDEDGEVGLNAGNINSIEFAQEQDKREAGLV